MDTSVIMMMMTVSIMLGAMGLFAFLWGLKNGQFDDKEKMMRGVHFDDERELNDAAEKERKKEELRKKNYRPE